MVAQALCGPLWANTLVRARARDLRPWDRLLMSPSPSYAQPRPEFAHILLVRAYSIAFAMLHTFAIHRG